MLAAISVVEVAVVADEVIVVDGVSQRRQVVARSGEGKESRTRQMLAM
jgi:hypothetical protein